MSRSVTRHVIAPMVLLFAVVAITSCGKSTPSADSEKESGASSQREAKEKLEEKASSAEFCKALKEVDENSQSLDEANIASDYRSLMVQVDGLEALAPKTVKGDVRTFASSMKKVAAAVEANGWNFKELDVSKIEGLDNDKFQKASSRIFEYQSKVCAVSPETTETTQADPGEGTGKAKLGE